MDVTEREADGGRPPLVCPTCRTRDAAWALGGGLCCENAACGEQHGMLTDGIPVVATDRARELIVQSDGCGPLPPAGAMGSWLERWGPGTREFGSVARAAIYLRAMGATDGSRFYGELCDALLPNEAGGIRDVLDVGCGPGNLAFELGVRLQARVTGLDLDAHMLRWGERVSRGGEIEIPVRESAGVFRAGRLSVPHPNGPGQVRFVAGNLLNPPFGDSSFDLVTLVNVLDQVAQPGRALRRAVGMVRAGGYVLFAQPDSWNAGTTPPERWLAEDDAGWDAVFERHGLETVVRVDDLEWVLVDAPRLRHVFRVHGRLLRKALPPEGERL